MGYDGTFVAHSAHQGTFKMLKILFKMMSFSKKNIIKITFVDKKTNEPHFLNPKSWTDRRRWSSHADMIIQYSRCIEKRLYESNYTDIELYFDIWRSMNHRFNQRQIDPRVDLTRAEWHPLKKTEWLMPLLTDLSDWRSKLSEIEKRFEKEHKDYDLTFVADFPGLKLENYVSVHLNTTLEVLKGQVNIEYDKEIVSETGKLVLKKQNITLNPGQRINVPSGAFHNVYTISQDPSCFLYIYINETAVEVSKLYERFLDNMLKEYNKTHHELNSLNRNILDSDNLTWKAFNLTMEKNSKEFLKMISYNETFSEEENDAELKRIQEIFEKQNLNYLYGLFSSHFRNHIKQTLVIDQLNLAQKFFKYQIQNMQRFKQR